MPTKVGLSKVNLGKMRLEISATQDYCKDTIKEQREQHVIVTLQMLQNQILSARMMFISMREYYLGSDSTDLFVGEFCWK